MKDLELQLLSGELSTQFNRYCDNSFSKNIVTYFSDPENKNFNNEFDEAWLAKNDWEACVDSLGNQVVILLDSDLNVIRTNRTIELWGWADVDNVRGTHVLNLIEPAIDDDSANDWLEEWRQLDIKANAEWESNNYISGKKLRFSFYPIRDVDNRYPDDNGYAVLSISDITDKKIISKNKHTKNRRKNYSPENDTQHSLIEIAEKKVLQLSEQLINSREFERKRVSCELHDGLGQILTALKFQISSEVNELEGTSQQRKNDIVLKDILDSVKIALKDLRRITVDLQLSVIDEVGLLLALNWFVGKYKKVYAGLCVDIQLDVYESKISDDKKNIIYRIVQEAMNNIAKHACAKNILLKLTLSRNGLLLCISDDGCGFDMCGTKSNTKLGLGLQNMEKRAISSDAKFTIRSNPLSGTIIQVFWSNS